MDYRNLKCLLLMATLPSCGPYLSLSGSSHSIIESNSHSHSIPVTSGKVTYKVSNLSLFSASLDKILEMLKNPDEHSRALLTQLTSSGFEHIRDITKKRLIEENKILFYSIFKNLRKVHTLPQQESDSFIAGAYSEDGNYLVLLRHDFSEDGTTTLELWSVDEIKSGAQFPREKHQLSSPGTSDYSISTIITASPKGNRFLIHGLTKWHLWKLTDQRTLELESTIIVSSNDANSTAKGTFSSEGTKLFIAIFQDADNPSHESIVSVEIDSLTRDRENHMSDLIKQSHDITFPSSVHQPYVSATKAITVLNDSSRLALQLWDLQSNSYPLLTSFELGNDFYAPNWVVCESRGNYLFFDNFKKNSIELLDMRSGIVDSIELEGYKDHEMSPFDTLIISECRRFALFSSMTRPSRLYDLETRKSAEVDVNVPRYFTAVTSMKHTCINRCRDEILQIHTGNAYIIELDWPLELLTIDQLILLSQLESHGAQLLSDPHYSSILIAIPDSSDRGPLRTAVIQYFNLDR